MSEQTTKRTYSTVKNTEFGGIDSSPFGSEGSSTVMNNFRILSDKSIEKREGFKWILSLPDTPTATWKGSIDGEESIFALVGDSVYCINCSSPSYYLVGTLNESSERACFFMIDDMLCILNGTNIYTVSSTGVSEVKGYVPLYGNGWSSGDVGEIYEPQNILSNHIRIRYKVKNSSNLFRFGLKALTIDRIRYNSADYSPGQLGSVLSDMSGIQIPDVQLGDTVEVYLTVKRNTDLLHELSACNRSRTYGNAGDTRAFCWNEGSTSARMFYSKTPDENEIASYSDIYSGTNKIYFPQTYVLSFGDGYSPIKAACRYCDRLVVFTEDATWSANLSESKKNELQITPLCSSVGCSADGAAVTNEDDLITISSSGIYKLTKKTSASICKIAHISKSIDALLPDGFFTDAISIYDRDSNECWFCLPYDTDGRVWIYNMKSELWFTFSGIGADRFFMHGGNVGFFRGKEVFIFDSKLKFDRDLVGSSITIRHIDATYSGKYLDFGAPERRKRLGRMSLICNTDGGEIALSASDENGNSVDVSLCGNASEIPECFSVRTRSGRFRYLKLSLECSGPQKQKIYALSVTAKF